MPRISVQRTKEDLAAAKAQLSNIKDGFEIAYRNALNTAVTGTQEDMVRIARDDYTFKVDAIRKRMWVKKSSMGDLTASVSSKGNAPALTDFLGTKQTTDGVLINVKRSTGQKTVLHAFIESARNSGKLLVFRRALASQMFPGGSAGAIQLAQAVRAGQINPSGRVWRYPIEALYGPHPEIVWNTEENWGKLSSLADTGMRDSFAYEIDRVGQMYG